MVIQIKTVEQDVPKVLFVFQLLTKSSNIRFSFFQTSLVCLLFSKVRSLKEHWAIALKITCTQGRDLLRFFS